MEFSETLRVLAEETHTRRFYRSVILWFVGVSSTILTALELYTSLSRGERPEFSFLLSIFGALGVLAYFSHRHLEALKQASDIGGKESARYLVEALATSTERSLSEICEQGLIRALQKVDGPEDFDDYQRMLLYKLLRKSKNQKLISAVLQCMSRIAGPEAIPYIESFLQIASQHKDIGMRRLADRALLALPEIRIRSARRIIESRIQSDSAEQGVERMRI